jgi:hypothetical protein
MNWLLRHVLEDHIKLTPAQAEQVRRKVQEYASRERWARVRMYLPGALPLLAIPFWIQFRKTHPMPLYVLFELAFAGVIVWIVFWTMKRMYSRFSFRAVRELGFADICARCGYDFTGLDGAQIVCPECGTMREPPAGSLRDPR